MSSFARAERRRQERAAASRPAERNGLKLVYQRAGGDCLNAAVASVLGLDLADTPRVDGFDEGSSEAWRRWVASRGLLMRQSLSHVAPCVIDRPWIAVVPAIFDLHAVVMTGGRMLHNPDDTSPLRAVGRRDVQAAILVGEPEWVEGVTQRTHALVRARDRRVWELVTPAVAAWHRANGRDAQARAVERELQRRPHALRTFTQAMTRQRRRHDDA